MKRTMAIVLAISCIICCLSGCGSAPVGDKPTLTVKRAADKVYAENITLTAAGEPSAETAAKTLNYAVELFKNGLREDRENPMISPFSVLCALAMTANGADGETLLQMEETFGVSVDELNKYFQNYIAALPDKDSISVDVNNSIWMRDQIGRLTVGEEFLSENAEHYGAEIYSSAFDEKTLKAVNDWVKEKTDGMIDEIIDDINPYDIMYIINTLAFEAEWSDPYQKNQITKDTFTNYDGETEKVDMMYSTESKYFEDDNAKGFIKNYCGGYAFAAILPDADVDIYDYIDSLDGDALNSMLTGYESAIVKTLLPAFEMDYDLSLRRALIDMGMTDLFGADTCDLTKLGESTEGNIYVADVLHKTYIKVDARGTKAGAATAVITRDSAAPIEPQEIKEVYLDRPFVYVIFDSATATPLFIGAATDM